MNRKQRRAGGKPAAATGAIFQEALRHHQAGRLAEAKRLYRLVLAADSRHGDALHLLGVLAYQQGRAAQAAELIAKAITINDKAAVYHSNLGNAFKDLGRADDAVAAYRRAIRLQPGYAEAHFNLGNALLDLGRNGEAVSAFAAAIALQPAYGDAYANCGVALRAMGRFGPAATAGKAALAVNPGDAEVYYNLGIALTELGQFDRAIAAYDRAIGIWPDYARARLNLAFVLLAKGDLARGWQEYEWRAQAEEQIREPFAQPQWDGGPIAGRRILLHAEQGLGDCIQFCRYATLVADRGATVILEAQRPLAGLLAGLAGVAQVVVQGEPLPDFDLHSPLISLPRIFNTQIETIPAKVPYLRAEDHRVAAWRRWLGGDGVKIGIAWQGNPGFRDDRRRSVPLAAFAPLARLSEVRLISLQKTHGLDQLDHLPAGMTVERLGPAYDDGDFAETAAVMMGLDLVVSSCTSVPHLAGALGRPLWLALGVAPYWAWMRQRDDSPWYPSLRLFRQATPGDWTSVFEQMAGELAVFTRRRRR